MKINYIKIRGAIGFKKGLGKDEVEFDLNDKTGLVALAGPNGKGKTTLLELMSPYRTFASRKGALRHHFFLRDSFIETQFVYNGDEYHTIRKIDSESDRAEAFIVVNGNSVVNGKLKEYDQYIIDLFGSQTLFYNSVFCAQGSGNLSDMTTGKIKELFVEFLRIERLAEFEKESKSGVSYCQKKIDVLNGQLQAINESIVKLSDVEIFLKEINISISENEAEIKGIDILLKNVESAIADMIKKSEKSKHDLEKKEILEKNLIELISDRAEIKTNLKALLSNHDVKKDNFDKDILQLVVFLENKDKIIKASSRIENLKKWEKYFSGCFECTMDEQVILDKQMKDIDRTIKSIETEIAALEDSKELTTLSFDILGLKRIVEKKESALDALEKSIKDIQSDSTILILEERIKTLKSDIELAIDPECISKICPAFNKIAEAKEQLPEIEKKLDSQRETNGLKLNAISSEIKLKSAELIVSKDALSKKQSEHDELKEANIDVLESLKKPLEANKNKYSNVISDYQYTDEFKGYYKSRLAGVRTLIDELEKLSNQKPQIEIAEAKKETLEDQFKTFVNIVYDHEKEYSKTFDMISKDILLHENDIEKIESNIDVDIKNTINLLNDKQDEYKKQLEVLSVSLESFKGKAAIFNNDLARKEQLLKDLSDKQKIESGIKKELLEWDYLRLACSKTGLQALEIDGAAPLITKEANELLDQAFGLDSQIKIITQDPESGREVFWIKVIREDGSEDDFGNLSGGQKVWIAKALSLGMTLVSKRKSGRNFMTLFADEEDGALDSEKALEFIQLYRSMMITGDFETCFYISHNPEVVAMADHVIDFGAL